MTAQPVTLVIPRWILFVGIAAHVLVALAIIIANMDGLHHRPPADAEVLHLPAELQRR